MFDDFREWLSDNLRYIILGLAVILVIIVGFFAIKMLKGSDSPKDKSKNDSSSESDTQPGIIQETGDETESESGSDDLLQQDAYPAVNEIINKYYTAQTEFDKDTLNTIVESLPEKDITKIEMRNEYIESYKNISCYTKKGLEDNSYFVFVYYELKFFSSEYLLPGLSSLYVCTNDSGQLYISAALSDKNVESYHKSIIEDDADIVALTADVDAKYTAVIAEHPELGTEMTSLLAASGDNSQPASGDSAVQVNKVVSVLQNCNVRADSTTGAEILGELASGTTVTRVQVLDNGWTEVKFGEGKAYVKSEFLSE